MRTDWSRGYITHPEVRPEEQHRLVPRSLEEYTEQLADRKQANQPTPLDRAREIIREQADQSVLDEAAAVIKDRGENYDHPLVNHQRIAALWSVVLGTQVTPLQVVQCMIAVKLARLIATPDHRDSLIDLCGYAQCAETIIVSTRDE